MSTVIIPAARDGYGPSKRPCWLQEHPAGLLVVHHLLRNLDMSAVSRVIIVAALAHVKQFLRGDTSTISKSLIAHGCVPSTTEVVILPLEEETSSAAATVAYAIRTCNVQGSIFIKDQDGCFEHRVVAGLDYVVGMRLTEHSEEVDNIPSKSFLLTTGALLSNIVEKRIVSDTIGLGGYAFQSAQDFLTTLTSVEAVQARVANNLVQTATSSVSSSPHRLFLSHIVQYQMLHEQRVFGVELSKAFSDWKTKEAWVRFVQRYRNVEVSLEGVLFVKKSEDDVMGHVVELSTDAASSVERSVEAIESAWAPVETNLAHIRRLPRERTHVTIRSSRSSHQEDAVRALLLKYNVPFDTLVLNSRAATTFVVTPFGAEGELPQHPSSVAYSIPTNHTQTLASVL